MIQKYIQYFYQSQLQDQSNVPASIHISIPFRVTMRTFKNRPLSTKLVHPMRMFWNLIRYSRMGSRIISQRPTRRYLTRKIFVDFQNNHSLLAAKCVIWVIRAKGSKLLCCIFHISKESRRWSWRLSWIIVRRDLRCITPCNNDTIITLIHRYDSFYRLEVYRSGPLGLYGSAKGYRLGRCA